MKFKINQFHYLAGLIISLFVIIHLYNHLTILIGTEEHIRVMQALRPWYRNWISETVLLLAVFSQIYTGLKLFLFKRKHAVSLFDKLQIWSGAYLAFFFCIHLSAVFGGRFVLNLDTNLYFGISGLNTFPLFFFFIPYYGLAIISFFVHIATIHQKKMKSHLFLLNPNQQSIVIMGIGIAIAFIILLGLTNGFKGFVIPNHYLLIK